MKIKYRDLLDQSMECEYKHKFRLSMRAWDIGTQAQSIANVAKKRIAEDGSSAQIHASNVEEWMGEILEMVNECMDIALDKGGK